MKKNRAARTSSKINTKEDVCPLCSMENYQYLFRMGDFFLNRCTNCNLVIQSNIHLQSGVSIDSVPAATDRPATYTEQQAAQSYLEILKKRNQSKTLLIIAGEAHPLQALATEAGMEVTTVTPDKEVIALPTEHFDSAAILYSLEKNRHPINLLNEIHTLLKPGGELLLVSQALDSWPARFFKSSWIGWQTENKHYFDSQTIQSALWHTGFSQIRLRQDRRHYTIQHILERAKNVRPTILTRLITTFAPLIPAKETIHFPLPSSGIIISAKRIQPHNRPLLSIIMPVFNEEKTVEKTLNAVLEVNLPTMDKEIIIIESNSSDSSRAIVQKFEQHPLVRLVLEDQPKGKGHAVRTGLNHAKGDFVLIQDADQEYDVNDYSILLEPLEKYQSAFVLGSRHSNGTWKIRDFSHAPGISHLYNFGHVLFGTLLNWMFRQRLKDPFTMYKVFRRDCLHGIKLESNRFDLDFEIVIKLVRKGYSPLEIPVNYRARSFREGKKVSTFRDPITWIWALIKYRFSNLYTDNG